MMMEATCHKESAFLTLTYSPENLPFLEGSQKTATLRKKHAQDFLKRLRKRLEPHRIRYFLVGEYGDRTQRPHYHAAIFGLRGSPSAMMNRLSSTPSFAENMVSAAWELGFSQTGILARESMEYIAGYVVKKMTKLDDSRLNGREPEFSLKSHSLGSGMVDEMASGLLAHDLSRMPDVPSVIRFDGKLWPIGQTLKRRLRKRIGRDEKTPQVQKDILAKELKPVADWAFDRSLSLKNVLKELHEGDADALVGRYENQRKRKTL
jgi:hypothetical protein